MNAGDIVRLKEDGTFFLVVSKSKAKKLWHRTICVYGQQGINGEFDIHTVSWTFALSAFEKINI